MSFKTSSLHQRDTRSFSSSKKDTSPYNSRSYQSRQPYDQANEQSNGIFETETDLREYQTAPKSNAAKNMRDLYNSNAVSEYVPSEYGTNENIKRKPDTEVKSLLSSFTNSIKGYSQLMKENKEKIAKYSASEKKNHIPKGRDSGNKKENGHSNNHNRAKSFSAQDSNEKTPGKKITPSTSAKKLPNSKYFREELQLDFHHEEAYGEEKFMSYTKDLESDLDQVSLRLASSIRKDFEKTAHNILHQHINKASLIEKDDTYRNREANYSTPRIKTEIGFTEESPYRANLSIEKRHIIPEKYEADRKPTPEKQKNQPFTLGQIENNNNWAKSDKKATPIVPALNKDVQKEFRSETKNYRSLEVNKANKYSITSEKKVIAKEQITPKQGYSPKKPAPVLEAKIGFSKNQNKQTFSPAIQSPSQGNLYENSAQLSISPGKNMTSASLRQEGIYAKLANLDDLHPEQKILKLQEISIQLMKEHHFDDALEYLLEADMLVRNELPANNPQQIYVYYLLGECYVKKLDYYRAEKVLGIAVNKYEENDREFGKDGKNACYYLALMVLQSHVYMSTKQFRHAFEVYKKLVKGVESYCLAFERENLKGIIPHILLIKYNMGECLSSLERREEADIVFHEVATKFNIQDQEQLEYRS